MVDWYKREVERMGRQREYRTAKALRKAIDGYFDAISRGEGVNREWERSPSMAGLYLHLGIGKSTWARYGDEDGLRDAVEYARLMMEDFWAGQLAGKFANGAKFALSANYGWSDKVTVGMDEETRKAVAGAGMTMEEKAQLLREVGQEWAQG